MSTRPVRFVMGTEEELLTVPGGDPEDPELGTPPPPFFGEARKAAPSLPGPGGLFNGYGRIYTDIGGHVELASAESDCPYRLAGLVSRQHEVVSRAVRGLRAQGHPFVLANNNHSGILDRSAATWGSHENHAIEASPETLATAMLPFLVSRVYGGAGGLRHPSCDFLASVRAEFMQFSVGGGTTEHRAIYSTCRDEPLMRGTTELHRLHLILGDGHRSEFNLALQFGATALALRACIFDPDLPSRAATMTGVPVGSCHVPLLRELNLLAHPGDPPRVRGLAVDVQQEYLDASRRFADSLDGSGPSWIPRALDDWQRTLDAFRRDDREWLSARLDAFAKYELYSAVLAEAASGWAELPGRRDLACELALLNQSYHEFASPTSAFRRLEEAGLLRHGVPESIAPGSEPEPHVPEVDTRARARARFIVENAKQPRLLVCWDRVVDLQKTRERLLEDPFAVEYGPWEPCSLARRLLPF